MIILYFIQKIKKFGDQFYYHVGINRINITNIMIMMGKVDGGLIIS